MGQQNDSDSQHRVVMRIELFPAAKDRLNDVCRRLGMTQTAVATRLIEWFAEQTDAVQVVVLGLIPQKMRAEVAAIILERRTSQQK